MLGVEKRAVAVERCKRAPNVLDADFGRAQLGINQRWRKSTGDIVSSKPEMKAGPRHFWARNQFSDHARGGQRVHTRGESATTIH